MQALDGLPLADFWQRAAAFATDVAIALVAVAIALILWGATKWAIETGAGIHQHRSYHINLAENEGARIALGIGVRVVSLVHEHMSLWHSMERALGYGAAALAETIVVKEKAYQLRQNGLH